MKRNNMSDSNLAKSILIFSLPLIASNLLQVLFNMSDIAVVGKFSGAHALGAVGSTVILVGIYTGFVIGMSTGINVMCAKYMGAHSDDDISKTIHSSFAVSVISGIVLMCVALFSARPLLELVGTKDELIDDATLYLHIYFLGIPALSVYNFGNAVLSAAGDTRHPLYFLTASGIINVMLNLFFVIVCGMSVDGVALASIIAQYLSATAVVIFLMRSKGACSFSFGRVRLHKGYSFDIVRIGIFAGVQNAIFYIANMFIQNAVNSFPVVVVEGYSAATNADNLVYDVMAAFYMACTSFMSYNFGAKNPRRALNCYYICLAYSFGIAVVFGILLELFGKEFLSLFANERDVIDAGFDKLRIMGFSYCVSAFMDCTISASRSMGKTLAPMIMVIFGSCIFRIIWIYTVFAHFRTIQSLYLLYIFSWTITALLEIGYFVRSYVIKFPSVSRL